MNRATLFSSQDGAHFYVTRPLFPEGYRRPSTCLKRVNTLTVALRVLRVRHAAHKRVYRARRSTSKIEGSAGPRASMANDSATLGVLPDDAIWLL